MTTKSVQYEIDRLFAHGRNVGDIVTSMPGVYWVIATIDEDDVDPPRTAILTLEPVDGHDIPVGTIVAGLPPRHDPNAGRVG